MLLQPSFGTRSHLKLWVGAKDPNEAFNWCDSQECACGQYVRAHYDNYKWLSQNNPPAIWEMNYIAQHVEDRGRRTFGMLYDALCKAGW